eukprot:579612-Pelagomonas_calceolata.AAC.4
MHVSTLASLIQAQPTSKACLKSSSRKMGFSKRLSFYIRWPSKSTVCHSRSQTHTLRHVQPSSAGFAPTRSHFPTAAEPGLPKKKASSWAAVSGASEPWQAL